MRFRVYFEDTDAMGIVYHSNYLRFCERARSEAFFLAGKIDELAGNGGFVLSECSAKWHASARLGDIIEVRTQVGKISRASCVINQQIFLVQKDASSAKMLLFSAELKMAHIDASGKATPMSEEQREFLSSLESNS